MVLLTREKTCPAFHQEKPKKKAAPAAAMGKAAAGKKKKDVSISCGLSIQPAVSFHATTIACTVIPEC